MAIDAARLLQRRRAVVAGLLQPARDLAQLAAQQPLAPATPGIAWPSTPRAAIVAQRPLGRVAARGARERPFRRQICSGRELGAAQVAELARARSPKIAGARVGDRVLVQRVEEHVLREVALGQRPQRARLEQRQALRLAQLARARAPPAPRPAPRGSQPVPRGQARRALRVSSRSQRQMSPRVDAEQLVQPRLVVGEPVLHHPRARSAASAAARRAAPRSPATRSAAWPADDRDGLLRRAGRGARPRAPRGPRRPSPTTRDHCTARLPRRIARDARRAGPRRASQWISGSGSAGAFQEVEVAALVGLRRRARVSAP